MPTQVEPRNRRAWRAWLERNHAQVTEVWLVLRKLRPGVAALSYNDAIEEALCFGWIDGVRRPLDAERYMHRLSPRKTVSKWSALNKARAERMVVAGLMCAAGLEAIAAAKRSGHWAAPVRRLVLAVPEDFEARLRTATAAAAFFATLAPSYQRQFRDWVASAKRAETREQRIAEALKLLAAGRKLGMR